jgi:hypothetical protein
MGGLGQRADLSVSALFYASKRFLRRFLLQLKEHLMSGKEPKNRPENIEPQDPTTRTPIETQDWDDIGAEEVEVQADDELAILGERRVEPADTGLSEDDDDNAYQESDEALPEDEEEAEIARDPEREGHRFE